MTPDKRLNQAALGSSFRDPDGFMFQRDGVLLRRVHRSYQPHYEQLMSGLYAQLVEAKLLIPHREVDESAEGFVDAVANHDRESEAFLTLAPERVGFISYPYEWSFSQLQDAALLTLKVQKMALESGMSLKDASAYNIQFHRGRPIHIDTLSFEIAREGQPWTAYRQFCGHFLAPLALMSLCDASLNQLLRVHLDGIPLDLASRLLPARTRLNFGLATHIHWHAAAAARFSQTNASSTTASPATASSTKPAPARTLGKTALLGLLDNLEACVRGLKWRESHTTWGDYYNQTNYDDASLQHKKRLVDEMLSSTPAPQSVWDLGANTGVFSRLASARQIPTVAWDVDALAVERNYLEARERGEEWLLPLVQDLTNPSPALGWQNGERMSLEERGPVDVAMALALVHHLAISNNVPLGNIARFFASLCAHLIIEWVPADDSQTRRLLLNRGETFRGYTQANFESAFGEWFEIRRQVEIPGTKRTLYLMENRNSSAR